MAKELPRPHRKPITFNRIILQVIEEEMHRRGGQTSYSALINEVLADRFVKEIRAKELELKANQTTN